MDLLGITNFSLFCLAVLLLNATPGPDTAYIIGRSVVQGKTAGVVSALGISAGCCIHAVASALGLSAILAASATAFLLVKLAGGAYLVYLGMRLMFSKSLPSPETELHGMRSLSTIFWQALATNVLNPKVILFFLAFIPQFVHPDASYRTLGFLVLGITLALISLGWNSGTAIVAGKLARHAGSNPKIRQWLERIVGASFVGIGVQLAFSQSR